MSIESEQDLLELRKVGRIVASALHAMQNAIIPGVTTSQLDVVGGALLHREGARSAPKHHYGFPTDTIVCVNDEIVHGIPRDRVIREGDLVTFDVTAERGGYIADAAVTVSVGTVSETHRRLAACTVRALARAVGIAREGCRIRHIGRSAPDSPSSNRSRDTGSDVPSTNRRQYPTTMPRGPANA